MYSINPLSAALGQSAQIQREMSTDKARAARRARQQETNIDARDDEMEHQVENSEQVAEIHEDSGNPQQRRKRNQAGGLPEENQDEDQPRLDLTA